jgi:hypothetical protein
VTVDDLAAHTAPGELVGQHQAGRPGPDDQHLGMHLTLTPRWVGFTPFRQECGELAASTMTAHVTFLPALTRGN